MPSTQAVLALRAASVEFAPHFYDYEERGGSSGFPASLVPQALLNLLQPVLVAVAVSS